MEHLIKIVQEESVMSNVFSINSTGANHLNHDSNKLLKNPNLNANSSASEEMLCMSFDSGNYSSPIQLSPGQVGELQGKLPSCNDSNIDGRRLHSSVNLPSGPRSQFSSTPTPHPMLSSSGLPSVYRSGLPSIRPNAMKNRQKQLDTLRQYEEKLRARKVTSQAGSKEQLVGVIRPINVSQNRDNVVAIEGGPNAPCTSKLSLPECSVSLSGKSCCCDGAADYQKFHRTPVHPMFVHTLDLSEAVTTLCVKWLPISIGSSGIQGGDPPPEETIFYSLVEGRGELIVFGGIQGDMACMQRAVSQTKNVTNMVYYLTAPAL